MSTTPTKTYGEDPSQGKVMPDPSTQSIFCTKADGYRGFWHGQTPSKNEYAYKYSGGLGTYPFQSRPMAIYAPAVNKTFFCWGATTRENPTRQQEKGFIDHQMAGWDFGPNQLLHGVSYYDHTTGEVPKPTIVFDKWCGDAHDNPVLTLDSQGHLLLFSPSHGEWTTRSFVHRSTEPYSIERFETIYTGLFAYPQAWWDDHAGLLFFHTQYETHERGNWGRGIYFVHSPTGSLKETPTLLAHADQGHYQITAHRRSRVATAFDYHPKEGGLDARTNLYYLESWNHGKTWKTVEGNEAPLPLLDPHHPCLVRDYQREGLLVYVKNLEFDEHGHPVILYTTSKGSKPGPEYGPHTWTIAHWNGSTWDFREGIVSGNNYDKAALTLEAPDRWILIGPSHPGPQPYNPGGEIARWISTDQGRTWTKERQITQGSAFNHTFVRKPLHAHPDFAAFWADGHARRPSESRLYFCNQDGTRVRRLPFEMTSDFATPEAV